MKNKIVSPSLLACNFLKLGEEIERLSDAKDIWLHLDIMDGHFVPNLTFGHEIIKFLSSVTSHPLDAHLMVSNPEFYIDTFKDFGIHNLTFHFEASLDCLTLIQKAKRYFPNVGISLKPKTPALQVPLEIYQNIDLLLVMSVEPGFGGQAFIEDTYQKLDDIMEIKNKYALSFMIQVDGGVSDQNASRLRQHGAENLVAGSFIFKSGQDHYSQQIQKLR